MLNYFTSVKSKLNIISFLTMAGFSILFLLMTYYSSTQKKYSNILDNLTELRLSNLNLNSISKGKVDAQKFEQEYKNTHNFYVKLHDATDEISLNLNILEKFDEQCSVKEHHE